MRIETAMDFFAYNKNPIASRGEPLLQLVCQASYSINESLSSFGDVGIF